MLQNYSNFHIHNIIKKGGYPTEKYERELENRKTRAVDYGWSRWFYFNHSIGRWIKINRKKAIRLKEKYSETVNTKILDKYIHNCILQQK